MLYGFICTNAYQHFCPDLEKQNKKKMKWSRAGPVSDMTLQRSINRWFTQILLPFSLCCWASITLSAMLATTYCLCIHAKPPQTAWAFSFFHPPLPFYSLFFKQAFLTFSIPLQKPSLSSQSLLKLQPPPPPHTHTTAAATSLRGPEWEPRTLRPQAPPVEVLLDLRWLQMRQWAEILRSRNCF